MDGQNASSSPAPSPASSSSVEAVETAGRRGLDFSSTAPGLSAEDDEDVLQSSLSVLRSLMRAMRISSCVGGTIRAGAASGSGGSGRLAKESPRMEASVSSKETLTYSGSAGLCAADPEPEQDPVTIALRPLLGIDPGSENELMAVPDDDLDEWSNLSGSRNVSSVVRNLDGSVEICLHFLFSFRRPEIEKEERADSQGCQSGPTRRVFICGAAGQTGRGF